MRSKVEQVRAKAELCLCCRSVVFSSLQRPREEAAIPWTDTFCARAAALVASKTFLPKSPLTANAPVLTRCALRGCSSDRATI